MKKILVAVVLVLIFGSIPFLCISSTNSAVNTENLLRSNSDCCKISWALQQRNSLLTNQLRVNGYLVAIEEDNVRETQRALNKAQKRIEELEVEIQRLKKALETKKKSE